MKQYVRSLCSYTVHNLYLFPFASSISVYKRSSIIILCILPRAQWKKKKFILYKNIFSSLLQLCKSLKFYSCRPCKPQSSGSSFWGKRTYCLQYEKVDRVLLPSEKKTRTNELRHFNCCENLAGMDLWHSKLLWMILIHFCTKISGIVLRKFPIAQQKFRTFDNLFRENNIAKFEHIVSQLDIDFALEQRQNYYYIWKTDDCYSPRRTHK